MITKKNSPKKITDQVAGWLAGWLIGWLDPSGNNTTFGPSCNLRLSRFSAKLKFQAGPERGNKGEPNHAAATHYVFLYYMLYYLCLGLLFGILTTSLCGHMLCRMVGYWKHFSCLGSRY